MIDGTEVYASDEGDVVVNGAATMIYSEDSGRLIHWSLPDGTVVLDDKEYPRDDAGEFEDPPVRLILMPEIKRNILSTGFAGENPLICGVFGGDIEVYAYSSSLEGA
ncbi:MAG: hypothetical protein M5R36_08090 [Deltaproteobacteria bacterium]|nr:hypothetical protein [Deltaproteobacteria bacterium]